MFFELPMHFVQIANAGFLGNQGDEDNKIISRLEETVFKVNTDLHRLLPSFLYAAKKTFSLTIKYNCKGFQEKIK